MHEFVGRQREEFHFDLRFRAILRRTRRQLEGRLLTVSNVKKGTFASLDEAPAEVWQHPGRASVA